MQQILRISIYIVFTMLIAVLGFVAVRALLSMATVREVPSQVTPSGVPASAPLGVEDAL
jgi:hypothetical protein